MYIFVFQLIFSFLFALFPEVFFSPQVSESLIFVTPSFIFVFKPFLFLLVELSASLLFLFSLTIFFFFRCYSFITYEKTQNQVTGAKIIVQNNNMLNHNHSKIHVYIKKNESSGHCDGGTKIKFASNVCHYVYYKNK